MERPMYRHLLMLPTNHTYLLTLHTWPPLLNWLLKFMLSAKHLICHPHLSLLFGLLCSLLLGRDAVRKWYGCNTIFGQLPSGMN